MTKYLLVGACLAMAACSTTKPLPHYSEAEQAAQRGSIGYWQPQPTKDSTAGPRVEPGSQADLIRSIFEGKPPVVRQEVEAELDSLRFVKVKRKPSFLGKLLGRTPQTSSIKSGQPLKIGKKSTVNYYYGPATVTKAGKKAQVAAGDGATASVIEKKAGPAQVASDSSTQNALLGGGNLAAVHGDGNTLPQTATTQQASDWRAELAKPAGEIAAVAGSLLLVGGCLYLIIAYKRRKAPSNNG